MAMITATFHANASETTKERSLETKKKKKKFISMSELNWRKKGKHTKVGG